MPLKSTGKPLFIFLVAVAFLCLSRFSLAGQLDDFEKAATETKTTSDDHQKEDRCEK